MPFRSESQRRYLWLKHPEIAKKWAAEYPNQGKLPQHATGAGGLKPLARGLKPIPVDQKLIAECRAVIPKKIGDLPQFLGVVGGAKVYMVDGPTIETGHDMDFTQGGNSAEDPGLHKAAGIAGKTFAGGEVYLDNRHALHDLPNICYHEALEMRKMKEGASYDTAHVHANRGELAVRVGFKKK
jgi:hypothetical protein